MGKASAPKADPRIGEAAMMSARTGNRYLQMMKEQAAISNEWAAEDRDRYQQTFLPLQDQFIKDAQAWDSPERQAMAAGRAGAAVRGQMDIATGTASRQMQAMGVSPGSGRSIEATRGNQNATALAVAGARNSAVDQVRQQGTQMQASAINMGQGLEVNPGTSLGMSNQAYGSGFQGAMSGLGQQGDLLSKDYQNRMASWQAQQSAGSSLWGGIGSLVGAFGPGLIASDENLKENKAKPKRSQRRSIEKMRIEEWDYKPGVEDGGRHIGTYAQDFQKQTGRGDGRSIPVGDAIGVTMGAVKEISGDLRKLTKEVTALKAGNSAPAPRQRSI